MVTQTGESTRIRMRKRGCSCTKDDFLPEKSFECWSNYMNALKETPNRFMNRLTTRSLDQTELNEVRAESHHVMKKTLTWWDLIWFGVGAVIGAGIFVLTGQEANQHSGPAVVISYAVSGVSALLSCFLLHRICCSHSCCRVELGDFMAFIAAGNIILEYVISGAAVARSWTSYFATLCNQQPENFRITAHNLSPDYSHLDPIAVVVIAIICVLAIYSVKGSSRLNYFSSIVHIIIIIFIIIAGLTHADTKNLAPFTPYGPRGIFQASAVLFFAYVGFDAVSTMAEETKNPGRDIPIGLIGSMVVVTFAYCMMALVLCLMQPYHQIDKDAPFTIAFEKVGMKWAKYLVAIGALKGMTTVLLVSAIGQARYLTHIARTHMMPPWLAQVNEKTGTPVNATVVMMTCTSIIALFTNLDIYLTSCQFQPCSSSWYYSSGVTTTYNRNKFHYIHDLDTRVIHCHICLLGHHPNRLDSIHNNCAHLVSFPPWVYNCWSPKRGTLQFGVSHSFHGFHPFAIWTCLLMVYYFLFGLHASYDTAMDMDKSASLELGTLQDDGKSSATTTMVNR
ncbi:Cationic amino acid transporter 1 [Bienertia sinuspersici]